MSKISETDITQGAQQLASLARIMIVVDDKDSILALVDFV